jgi:DNA adenine methylase
MGSAAIFFELSPGSAALSDMNEDLVVCFQQIAQDPFSVMDRLDEMPNTREFYLATRKVDPGTLDPVGRAARVIYLNKTGFRGLWRVNRKGQFNVPYGEYRRPYYNRDNLLMASKALQDAEILQADYREAFVQAQQGDFMYLDPPYVPDRAWGDFKRYTPQQFDQEDHLRLASYMEDAREQGIFVMLTNSDTPFVRQLFRSWTITELATRRDIHLKSWERTSRDLVITNYTDFREPNLPIGT